MISKSPGLMLIVLSVFVTLSCSSGGSGNPNLPPDEDPYRYTFAASELPRDENPNIPPLDLNAIVNGNTEFAFDLYGELMSGDGNIFYSPFSISQALAMTWAGARNNTASQMAATMHFDLPQNSLHPAFNKLDLELSSRGEGASGADGEGFRLKIANSTWGQQEWSWVPDFLDVLAVSYGAGMRLVDFITQPEECRVIINDWVEDRTEGKIPDLLPQGVIGSDTRLVLVNAIYFNAAWLNPFEEENTHSGNFTLLDGSTVNAQLMEHAQKQGYTEGDGWRAVEIMYDGKELSMVIILPDVDRFEEIESSLDAEMLNGIVNSVSEHMVDLTFPKFEYESQFSMVGTLTNMGITDAFMGGIADFSGMDGSMLLYITDVIHKAFVSVNEAGTEAAAATGVIIGEVSMPMPATFTADHPFIFFIRDIQTGAILFIGRVLDPNG